MISGIKPGDIFIAADDSKNGHLVIDVTSFADCDDVVTIPFTEKEISLNHPANRIDFFKLTQVRYYRPHILPDWVPDLPCYA